MKNKLKKDGLNIIPFIDIILVLLCIVLSISTFIVQGKIEVNLPQSKSGTKSQEDIKFIILVDANSSIFLNEKPIDIDELSAKIDKIDANTTVILKSDKEAKFERFVQIIDILKLKKHDNVIVATEVRE